MTTSADAALESAREPARSARNPSGTAAMMIEDLARERRREKLALRWATAIAVVFHGVLLSVTLPTLGSAVKEFHRERKVFVLQQNRFRPPPPPKGQQKPPERKKKKVPIPDPTPDEPEPIVDLEIEVPEIELPDVDVVFGIPDAPPPGWGLGYDGDGPYRVGGNVSPPVKIHSPQPHYTEEARMARVQGIVILQTIVDEQGDVRQIKVLKDLPLGLTESAIETVKTWKFEPAKRGGVPVPVFFHLQIRFSLQ